MPEPSNYRLDDSRRLTGGNLYWDRPSAILDVSIEGDPTPIVAAWEASVVDWLAQVGYPDERTTYRIFDGGASLLISAPIDVLYSMCELNEVAWAAALHARGEGPAPDPGPPCHLFPGVVADAVATNSNMSEARVMATYRSRNSSATSLSRVRCAI